MRGHTALFSPLQSSRPRPKGGRPFDTKKIFILRGQRDQAMPRLDNNRAAHIDFGR
jgi:hypothetical protein